MRSVEVLIFVEDPGAANFVAGLPTVLKDRGIGNQLITAGSATKYLGDQGIKSDKLPKNTDVERLLVSSNAKVILVGTSENKDSLGLKLLEKAMKLGIESIGVIDSIPNAEYRFRGRGDSALSFAPNWILVPDEQTKNAYVDLGFPESQTLVCGHPHYEYVGVEQKRLSVLGRSKVRKSVLEGPLNNRKVIVFATEVSSGLNPSQFQMSSDYTLKGRGKSVGRTEIVIEEFLDSLKDIRPRPYLVLRLHPKNTLEEYSDYLSEFDQISTGDGRLDLIYAADVVVGMTSMILVEAVLMGIATMSIIPREVEMEWLVTIGTGMTKCAKTRSKIRATLMDILDQTTQLPSLDVRTSDSESQQHIAKFIEHRINNL